MQVQLFVGNTMNVLLEGLRFEDPGTYINDASTATLTIYDKDGAAVETINLAYVVDSNGNYTGVIPSTADLTQDLTYPVKVVAIKDTNQGEWWETMRAVKRRFGQ